MKNLKIGIIGLGRLGFIHGENIAYKMKGAELHAACGSDMDRLKKNQQLLDIPVITTDYDEFINMEELDGIVIASASSLHFDHLLRECKAGIKYIFIEKPIALTSYEIARLEEALPRMDVNIQVGHHRRYDPSYIEAKRKIKEGYIGIPIFFRNDNRDFFFDCIRTGREPAVTAEDGIKSVKWALKATEAVMGKKIVNIDE